MRRRARSGSESLRTLATRVHAACDELLEVPRDQEIVVVTHATPIKVAMAWALGVDISNRLAQLRRSGEHHDDDGPRPRPSTSQLQRRTAHLAVLF